MVRGEFVHCTLISSLTAGIMLSVSHQYQQHRPDRHWCFAASIALLSRSNIVRDYTRSLLCEMDSEPVPRYSVLRHTALF